MMEAINFKSLNQTQLNNVLTKQVKAVDMPTEEQETKDVEIASKTPMEMLGRSQVNFKQKIKQFSVKDLNYIGEQIEKYNFNKEELSTFKATLIETMNELKIKNIKELQDYSMKDLDNIYYLMQSFFTNAKNVNPNVNAEKIYDGLLALI